ncbi:MAG: hypothetical protein ACRC2U_11555, partial [Aeromonas sp.]
DQQAKQQGSQPLFGTLRQWGREETDHQQGAERDQQALSGHQYHGVILGLLTGNEFNALL